MSNEKEALQFLEEKLNKRDQIISTEVRGNYKTIPLDLLYNDADKEYKKLPDAGRIRRTVSSIDSLIAAVKEEAKRRNNEVGKYMTMSFTNSGGYFSYDDNENDGGYKFERELSQQWKAFKSLLGQRNLTHSAFYNALIELSPSIKDSKETLNTFCKLKIIGNSEVKSNPVFTAGDGAEFGTKVKYSIKGQDKTQEEVFPENFSLKLPYAKGSKAEYEVTAQVIFSLEQSDPNMPGKLYMHVVCPEIERIEEDAIMDEIAQFKTETVDVSELLILEDF